MKRIALLALLLTFGVACTEENPGVAAARDAVPSKTEALQGLRSTVGLTSSQISDATALEAAEDTCSMLNSGQQTFDRVTSNIYSDTSISTSQRETHWKVFSWSVAYFCPWHVQS